MNFTEAIVLAVEKVKAWIQSGGVKWDHVSDKPFVKQGGDTLTWDGNTEGLVSVADMFYKVSDAVPTMDDLANGAIFGMTNDSGESGASEIPLDSISLIGDMLLCGEVFIATKDNTTFEDFVFPKKGIYFIRNEGLYISSLTIPGYTGFAKEQIDPKVLPEALQFGKTTVQGDTLEWDGNTEGLVSVAEYGLYKISDATPTFTDLNKGGVLHFEGEAMPMAWNEGELAKEDVVTPQGVVMMSALYIVPAEMAGVTDETLEMTFPEAGIYTAPVATQLHLNGYSGFTKTEIKPIKSEYLPGAVMLYPDAENYLYADSDTSDTSKRITKAQLQAFVKSGRTIYIVGIGDYAGGYLPATVIFEFMEVSTTAGIYTTAEYTA